MSPDLIIFDFDGVIADSADSYSQAYQKTFAYFGRPDQFKDFHDWYDSEWENNWLRAGFRSEQLPEAIAYFWSNHSYALVKPFPGIECELKQLGRSAPLVICSTTDEPVISGFLRQHGLEGYFQEVFGREQHRSAKFEIFERALKKYRVKPARAVIIGDTAADVRPARQLGCCAAAVTYGWYSPERIVAEAPDIIIEAPEQITRKLEEASRP